MLSIFFGDINNESYAIESYFYLQHEKEECWGNDQFIQKIVKEIDNCDHIIDNIFKDETFGTITLDQVSGGSKNLILMYKYPTEVIYRATNCGENCARLIEEIASIQDIQISLAYMMILDPSKVKGGIYCLNENRFLKDIDDYMFTLERHRRTNIGFPE